MKNFNKIVLSCLVIFSLIFFTQQNSYSTTYPFNVTLIGAAINPPNASPGIGNIAGTFDDVSSDITFNLTFNGLLGTTTAAHFHAPADLSQNAPVIIDFVGFPTGVTFGFYANAVHLTSQQRFWLFTDSLYVDIHTNVFPGGEIRQQILLGIALPVELASFSSMVNRNFVTLNWSTVTENNNSGFDVERKITSSNEWAKIGNVEGNGTTNEVRNYSFTDRVNTGHYNYRLKQIDFNGNYEYFNLSNEVYVGVVNNYSLSQNYPNPFNPTTEIDYNLPYDGKVSIVLSDISGKEVATLVNETKTAGYYTVQFNANTLSSGIYFYRISAEGNGQSFVMTRKMLLMK